jgi:hypothetical protein
MTFLLVFDVLMHRHPASVSATINGMTSKIYERHYIAHPAHRCLGIAPGQVPPGTPDAPQPSFLRPIQLAVVAGGEALWFDTSSLAMEVLQRAENPRPIHCQRAWNGFELGGDTPFDCLLLLGSPAGWSSCRQKRLIEHCQAGRPLVALAAAHGTLADWPGFACEVLGGRDVKKAEPQPITVRRSESEWHHPLLEGFQEMIIEGDVYQGPRLPRDATVLLEADAPNGRGSVQPQPAAWLHRYRKARVFCSTLGRPTDFENTSFVRLLQNVVVWACRRRGVA